MRQFRVSSSFRSTALFAALALVVPLANAPAAAMQWCIGTACPKTAIVPLIDYHTHLLGPYALPIHPPLPEVKVPPDIV